MRLIRIKFLCGMILLMGSQGVFAEIDPYYLSSPSCVIDRGNPARTGEYVAEPLIKNHEVKWAVDVPGRASLICYNNSIIANGPTVIDINTGKISWQVYNQFFGSGNLLYKEKLYATSDQIDGTSVVEYDPATGKKVMQISNEHNKHGGFSPLAYNDILYFNVSNSIVAYDLKNKKLCGVL
ncbi:MAG: hypothetical protein HWD59_02050 [Coxiellaceae bacterium]|nr:MAG: hypothetical protein HWD59_02050 [Coxiellaceae bacterium]